MTKKIERCDSIRRTKIVATYGPAVATVEQVRALVAAGVNVFRVNCSHGDRDDFIAAARLIREATGDAPFPVGLLFDISGPKLRLARFEGEIRLEPEQTVTITAGETDLEQRVIGVNHPGILQWVREGDPLFIDDGNLIFNVVDTGGGTATLEAVNGGTLRSAKGINLPESAIDEPTISTKDREDIRTAVEMEADFIALSFVRTGDDIIEAKTLVNGHGGRQAVLAKLEKREAIERLEEIITLSDGVMVARGDLGVELPPEELPVLQKRIIRTATGLSKPVIVATQMLESMRFSPRATRAEINDVASAVFDYADAVMLSAETATGEYPLESVTTMARVLEVTEGDAPRPDWDVLEMGLKNEIMLAVGRAIRDADTVCRTRLIAAFTTSGLTASLISKLYPAQPILALAPDAKVARQLSLSRSIYPVVVDQPGSFVQMLESVERLSVEYGLAEPGDRVIISGGAPFDGKHQANLMLIHELPDGARHRSIGQPEKDPV